MSPPHDAVPPIGLQLATAARAVSKAFDTALNNAGGSRPTWLILLSLKTRPIGNQRQLAAAVGIEGATLTYHLNALERDGLLTRRRDPSNRRVHLVELTDEGEAAFLRLREAAMSHDTRLRDGLDDTDLAHLRRILNRMRENVTTG